MGFRGRRVLFLLIGCSVCGVIYMAFNRLSDSSDTTFQPELKDGEGDQDAYIGRLDQRMRPRAPASLLHDDSAAQQPRAPESLQHDSAVQQRRSPESLQHDDSATQQPRAPETLQSDSSAAQWLSLLIDDRLLKPQQLSRDDDPSIPNRPLAESSVQLLQPGVHPLNHQVTHLKSQHLKDGGEHRLESGDRARVGKEGQLFVRSAPTGSTEVSAYRTVGPVVNRTSGPGLKPNDIVVSSFGNVYTNNTLKSRKRPFARLVTTGTPVNSLRIARFTASGSDVHPKSDNKSGWTEIGASSLQVNPSKTKPNQASKDSFGETRKNNPPGGELGAQKKSGDAKVGLFGGDNSEALRQWGVEQERALIDERRRMVEEKRQLMEDKIKFHQEVNHIMNELRIGNLVDIRQKLVSGPPARTDPSQWEGINGSVVYKTYPGIIFLSEYVLNQSFVDPDDPSAAGMQGQPKSLADLTDGQAEERFFQLLAAIHVDCIVIRRIGSLADGGWDLCTVQPYELQPDCLVYSFGINFDFTFDDAIASKYGCTVKAFDPSMKMEDHVRSARVHFYRLGLGPLNTVNEQGWKLMTLSSIRERLGHNRTVIDVLKMDIDYNEWDCLDDMLAPSSSSPLALVKQLVLEVHTPEVQTVGRASTALDFYRMYGVFKGLERAGFRRYNVHQNPLGQYASARTGKTRSCCYELYYINIRFLR